MQQLISNLKKEFCVIADLDLDPWHSQEIYLRNSWLECRLADLVRESFADNERIVLRTTKPDIMLWEQLQKLVNRLDISNYFVILITPGQSSAKQADIVMKKISKDPVPITVMHVNKTYEYNSVDPIKIDLESLSKKHQFMLSESRTFCMYPWIHLHAYPTGEAWPCCQAEMSAGSIGNCKSHTLKDLWNSDRMKRLRTNMLTETKDSLCVRCYEQEDAGFFSGRQSANKHHGHHIDRIDHTHHDGTYENFQMTYWDIRFSNLCNLRCRSCGHIFSSSWYQDQVKLAGDDWAQKNKVLNYAGRHETDVWEQLIEHLDYVEQIYFAGGEPLMMDEHYRILEELERRGRFDVRLIYNTNFTQTRLKNRHVFDYWKKFDSVAVGASLDASDARAEYIRKGTQWEEVEANRQMMLKVCPQVDFYISATLSIMNAWHLPDFHKDWVNKGLIRPQDFNINILQDPPHYRLDIATDGYKQKIKQKFEDHLLWLRPEDKLHRAVTGYESAIKYMMSIDNSHLLPTFWEKTHQLDRMRNENILSSLPELGDLL